MNRITLIGKSIHRTSWALKKLFCSTSAASNCGHPKKRDKKLKENVLLKLKEEKHELEKIRNVGIIAHIDAGKTTTTERMLFYAGLIRSMGDVDRGDTVTDYMVQERERGITITSAAVTFTWDAHRINLIDTPGHVDFTLEVERCLRVLDGAVTILDASKGVEAQTMKVWSQAKKFGVPSIIYLNKMDKPSASVEKCLKSVEENLKIKPLLINEPFCEGKDFYGVTDYISMQRFEWSKSDPEGKLFKCIPLDKSRENFSRAYQAREKLIGTLCDFDGKLSDAVLEHGSVDDILAIDIEKALRRATLSRAVVPVLCGSSAKKMGVQLVLSAICKYLPSPVERRHAFLDFYDKGVLCALVFKIVTHAFLGRLTFLRIYGGVLSPGSKIYNVNRDLTESVQKVFVPQSDEMREVGGLSTGNIAAVSGFVETITGDTLVENSAAAKKAGEKFERWKTGADKENLTEVDTSCRNKLVLASIDAPEPVVFCSIEPPSLAEVKKFDEALAQLVREDPSLRVSVDPDSLQTILRGMGELQIEIVKDRLLTEFGLNVFLGQVQIGYKETLKNGAQAEGSHEIIESHNQKKFNVNVHLAVQHAPGTGFLKEIKIRHVKNETAGLNIVPQYYKDAVRDGCINACYRGPSLSYPIQDVQVTLCDFYASPGATTSLVNACANQCLRGLFKEAGSDLLEPIMDIEITVPERHAQSVMIELAKRRANITKSDWFAEDQIRRIFATAPLSELFGFSKTLRTLTSGTSDLHMQLAGHEIISPDEVARLQKKQSYRNR